MLHEVPSKYNVPGDLLHPIRKKHMHAFDALLRMAVIFFVKCDHFRSRLSRQLDMDRYQELEDPMFQYGTAPF